MTEYELLVDQCAAERRNWRISNGSAKHSRYLIKKLFDVAKNDVVIYCGNLPNTREDENGPVEVYAWAPLIDSARNFLRKDNARLRVLLQHPIQGIDDSKQNKHDKYLSEENIFLTSIGDMIEEGKVFVASPDGDILSDLNNHFISVDDTAYRFELDHGTMSAVAGFNSPKRATQLRRCFDILWDIFYPCEFSSKKIIELTDENVAA